MTEAEDHHRLRAAWIKGASRRVTASQLGELATALSATSGRIVLMHDEASQLVRAVAMNWPAGVTVTPDQSSPDTSQEYFLDLIARIDDATTGDE